MNNARRRMSGLPLVVFTDLDGTLLDHHDYSWTAAEPALERLRDLQIPLVLNSSKTRSEISALRHELENHHPFVVENGSAVYTPKGYFEASDPGTETLEEFEVEFLAPPRSEILRILHSIRRRHGFRFRGFSDFSLQEIQQNTGLGFDAARAAAQRDGTEPLLWQDENRSPADLAKALEGKGLRLVAGGRFWHAMGPVDKGNATRFLLDRFKAAHPSLQSMALGDSANDIDMLCSVDYPVVIPRLKGSPLDPGPLSHLVRAPSPGPAGWRWAVDRRLATLVTGE